MLGSVVLVIERILFAEVHFITMNFLCDSRNGGLLGGFIRVSLDNCLALKVLYHLKNHVTHSTFFCWNVDIFSSSIRNNYKMTEISKINALLYRVQKTTLPYVTPFGKRIYLKL
jgi:hypothetical protein